MGLIVLLLLIVIQMLVCSTGRTEENAGKDEYD